jgi:hypothetical protein
MIRNYVINFFNLMTLIITSLFIETTFAQTSTTSWVNCATEYSTCSFTGTRRILYGASKTSRNVIQTHTSRVECSNSVFGDPAPGIIKKCWYESKTVVPPTPSPTVMINTAPNSFVNSTSASITFSGTNTVSYQCQINGAAYANCSSPYSVINLAANSAHVFRVRGTSSTGVVSSVAETQWTIDTIAPTLPFLLADVAAVTQSRSASISFSSVDALAGITRYECSVNSGAFSTCSNPRSFSNISDSQQNFSVRAIDNAGNTSQVGSFAWRVDATAPALAFSQTPLASTTETTASFSFASSDAGSGMASVQCSLDTAAFANCTSPVSLTGLSIAAHQYRVRATDLAGNQVMITHNWTVSQNPPPPPPTLNWVFCAEENSICSFTGTRRVLYGSSPTEGNVIQTHSSQVDCSNSVFGDPVVGIFKSCWYEDTTVVPPTPGPTVTINTAPSSFTNSTSASITFSGADIVSYQCQIDSAAYANCSSPYSVINLAANSAHIFRVRGTDSAGAVSAVAEAQWTIDTLAPALAFTQTPQDSTTANFSFSSSDSGSGLATTQCSLNTAAFANCTSPVSLTGLSIAAHQYRVRATDLAGNQVTITHNWTVTQNNPPPPVVGSLVPAAQLEFVNASGVRQKINVVDGQTQVNGVAPFLIQIDASGTRAPAAFAAQSAVTDAEAYAFLNVGYRIHFGENLSGSWRYPEGSSFTLNEETGPPVFSRIYHSAGAYSVRLKTRDTVGNEVTLRFTVNVTAAPAATHIPVSAGSWPAFQSNRRYTLQAGGDYRSFGTIETGGLHNISFEKTGTGTDPRISNFSPDGRSKFSATQMFEARASHIRLINIDMNDFSEGQRGFDYVAVVGGLIRKFNSGPQAFAWAESTEIIKSNARYSRGLFFENTEVFSTAEGSGFVMFGTFHGFHTRGTRFIHKENGPTTYLMLRLYGRLFSLRNNYWFSEVDGGGANGVMAGLLAVNGATETVWRDDDLVGPLSATQYTQSYGYISDKMFLQHNQFYGPGSYLTNAINTMGGGNPSGTSLVRPRLIGAEDNVFYPLGDVARAIQNGQLGGQHNFWRNNRKDMGRGAYVPADTFAPNRGVGDNTTFEGPYHITDVNPRPTPTGF